MWRLTTSGRFPSDPMVILGWPWAVFEEAHEVLDFLVEAEKKMDAASEG